jgi:Ca2+-transporting ATPase
MIRNKPKEGKFPALILEHSSDNSLMSQKVDLMESEQKYIYSLSVEAVYPALDTRPDGLNQSEAEKRLHEHGPNVLQEVKGKPLYLKFLANFTHLMAILLWIGGIVALIAQMPQLAIAVWMVNLINGIFSFWQEYRAEKATQALRKLLPTYARVLRDGEEQRILAEDLVPGDVILLEEGDSISADCRLVQEAELRVDQSTLTGESRPVSKRVDPVIQQDITYTEIPNLIFSGTHIAAGNGKAVVFATGMSTEFGKIARLTQSVGEELSPLQKEMASVTKVVTIIAVLIGVLFFILAAVLAGITPADSFIFALGMIVAFVPEGLLPTVTLALAMGTQRMARRHALIKKLSAVETLGCTTVICTDKTGTLTQNEMTVRSIWLPDGVSGSDDQSIGRRLSVDGIGYRPVGDFRSQEGLVSPDQNKDLRQLLFAAAACNNSRLLPPQNGSKGETPTTDRWTILGDPTEAALKVAAAKGGVDIEAELQQAPRVRELPFESRRKRMSTIHIVKPGSELLVWAQSNSLLQGKSRDPRVAFVKGAPKEVLELCNAARVNGCIVPMSDELRARVVAANDEDARSGLRVLAVAMRFLPDLETYSVETVEHEMVLLGLVAMMDPPRPEVAEAVKKCHAAGIRIIMITGDYGLTAESIARRIGIIRSAHPHIVTGFDLDSMDDASLEEILRDEVIFARVAPEHKLRVVSALQDLGQIVAVTGDGVNDSPALRKADIGVAMGQAGSDVAKEAADMILTDDNFASIVNAVEEGRAVYDNIKKFTTYIFTSNTPEAVPFILFAFSRARIPLALNVMHVLSIDLGTDLVPALGLGAELPEPGIMARPPRNLSEHVITPTLLRRAYLWLGPVQSLAAMAAFYYQYWTHGYWGQFLNLPANGELYRSATAMALAAVVTTQIGNLFAQRTERASAFRIAWFKNRLIWIGIATELVLIFLIVYIPFLNAFIGTAPFPLTNWLFLFAWMPALLLVDEVRKFLVRRRSVQS